jgi:hypothetical protein
LKRAQNMWIVINQKYRCQFRCRVYVGGAIV